MKKILLLVFAISSAINGLWSLRAHAMFEEEIMTSPYNLSKMKETCSETSEKDPRKFCVIVRCSESIGMMRLLTERNYTVTVIEKNKHSSAVILTSVWTGEDDEKYRFCNVRYQKK